MPLISPTEDHRRRGTSASPGSLFVVATPIGHMEDITFRAVRILGEVDVVAAEDTRHSGKLLSHYGISTPLVSFHDHNKEERAPELLERIQSGGSVALITDAGTPSISDPGYYLVKRAVLGFLPVVPVPGPSAVIAALSVSALPTDSFLFIGFVPKKGGRRHRLLEGLKEQNATLVFYESPKRMSALVETLLVTFGDREAVMARELTKIHEEVFRGRLSTLKADIAGRDSLRGECTLLVAGASASSVVDPETVREYLRKVGEMSLSDRVKAVADRYGISRKVVYEEALRWEREGEP